MSAGVPAGRDCQAVSVTRFSVSFACQLEFLFFLSVDIQGRAVLWRAHGSSPRASLASFPLLLLPPPPFFLVSKTILK